MTSLAAPLRLRLRGSRRVPVAGLMVRGTMRERQAVRIELSDAQGRVGQGEAMPLRQALRVGGWATVVTIGLAGAVVGFDNTALAVLSPDIQDTLGASDAVFGQRLLEAFEAVTDLSPSERAGALETLEAESPDLARALRALLARDRVAAGPTAPADGLTLTAVGYPY